MLPERGWAWTPREWMPREWRREWMRRERGSEWTPRERGWCERRARLWWGC
ncbi:hypothetical protein JOF29_004651 [Kribbella aluminosa]|uniref:Uncharacterized protein n=1 Tax=Kribbella aluminosa TaxID=416017 RepID=A0ABS4UPH9_9ACTN|nr:hypothetical protein [Kribbella aluminosa]MBP2353541.1 hypothetical protein [Kribbella aluminosa]